MKKAHARKPATAMADHLGDECRFDYSKAKPNRFASRGSGSTLVVAIDDDVSNVFSTTEAVNKALRALITAMPRQTPPKKVVSRNRRRRGA